MRRPGQTTLRPGPPRVAQFLRRERPSGVGVRRLPVYRLESGWTRDYVRGPGGWPSHYGSARVVTTDWRLLGPARREQGLAGRLGRRIAGTETVPDHTAGDGRRRFLALIR